MTTRPRSFLLDENMPKSVLVTLRKAGYTATRVRDERLGGEPDSVIFAFARIRQMTIVTFDTDYLSRTKFPLPHAGILVLRFFPRNTHVREIAAAVLSAVRQLAPYDISNCVYRLDPDGIEEE
ncbi:MAG: DUF5615 family PIN-like protein [Ktedonobacteraceae bacterium]